MSVRSQTLIILLSGALLGGVAWLLLGFHAATPELDTSETLARSTEERRNDGPGGVERTELEHRDDVEVEASERPLPAAGTRVVASGLVLRAATREPVAGATVRDLHGLTTTSDARGFFELATVLEDRRAVLLAHADGFLSGTSVIWSHRVIEGRSEREFLLRPAAEGAVLRGRIMAEGRPVPDAEVRLAHRVLDNGPRVLPATTSAADGAFELSDIAPGRYVLQVFALGYDDYVRGVLQLPRGPTNLGSITLAVYPWARLEGRVTDGAGGGVSDVQVSVRQQGRHLITARTDAAGRYAFDRVEPGRRSIRFVQGNGFSVGRTIVLQPNERRVENVPLPVGDHFVGGRVTVDGTPAASYEVSCELSVGVVGFDFVALDGRVAADGSFRLDGLPAGPVSLRFTKERPYSIHTRERVALDRGDYTFDFQSSELEVAVRGTVRDGEGGPLADVHVSPWHPSGPEERATTDRHGNYSLRTTVTSDSSFPIQAERRGFVTKWQPISRSSADSAAVVQLDFTLRREAPAPPLDGAVANQAGQPLARVFCVCRVPGRDTVITYSDSLGRFRFEGVSPGEVELHFRHADYAELRLDHPHDGASMERPVTMKAMLQRERKLVVLGSGDVPLAEATVNVWVRGAYVTSGFTDAAGRVTLSGLPEGEVEFSVDAPSHPRAELLHEVRGDLLSPLTFRVPAGQFSIRGKVVDATGSPRAGVELILKNKAVIAGASVHAILVCDQEGGFEFGLLPAGAYTLQAWSRAGTAQVDVRAGDLDVVVRTR